MLALTDATDLKISGSLDMDIVLDYLKARFRFLLIRCQSGYVTSLTTSSLAFACFASVPRAFGAHAGDLWQV